MSRFAVDLDALVVTPPVGKAFEPSEHPRGEHGRFVPKDAATILGTKVGGQGGSNPGGIYLGTDGIRRYVKFYHDPVQAHGEVLANQLYRDLGHPALESQTFPHDGKTAYASVMLAGSPKQLGQVGLSKARADRILSGYAADVLTANWDAVGLSHDNILLATGDRPVRVDQGGAFLMRAKAGRKPEGLLNQITEFDQFANPHVNPSYAQVFTHARTTPDKLAASLRGQVELIRNLAEADGGWMRYVQRHTKGLALKEQARIAEMLTARTNLLAERVGLLAKADDIEKGKQHKPKYQKPKSGKKGGNPNHLPAGSPKGGEFAAKGEQTFGGPRDLPTAMVEWRHRPDLIPEPLNGVPFTHWTPPEDWSTVPGQLPSRVKEPPLPEAYYNYMDPKTKVMVHEPKMTGAGVLIREPDGRVWVVEPMNHYGGYDHTFPKGTQEPGMTLQQTAIKEAWEESGLKVRLLGHATDVVRDTSVARYYWAVREAGTPTGFGEETFSVKLTPPEQLPRYLNRERDRGIATQHLGVEFPPPPPAPKYVPGPSSHQFKLPWAPKKGPQGGGAGQQSLMDQLKGHGPKKPSAPSLWDKFKHRNWWD
jgi:ADP-ribose pyrophosphatase YjhB (NUDIX family)